MQGIESYRQVLGQVSPSKATNLALLVVQSWERSQER